MQSHQSPCGWRWEVHKASSPMLSPCHCPGSCPVLTLWGTNPKLPGPSRPLSPAKSRFTHCYSSLIFCHPKTLLTQLSGITVTWKRVSTLKVLCFSDLRMLAASAAGLSRPSRLLQGQERPPGGVARAPRPQQVRATGKSPRVGVPGAWRRRDGSVQLWSSPGELGLRGPHKAAPSPTSPTLGAPGVSVPCASVPCAPVPGLQPRPRPAAASTPTGNFP